MENLATVMTLYSRRTFSKESFQWTKCVVKYLHDSYGYLTLPMVTFLVEVFLRKILHIHFTYLNSFNGILFQVLERGPNSMQGAVLSILHCLLHYVDFNLSSNAQQVNADLLRVIAKYIEVMG